MTTSLFIQESQKEYSKITIRFRNKEDMDDFSRIINQKLTTNTKSIWHPRNFVWNSIIEE